MSLLTRVGLFANIGISGIVGVSHLLSRRTLVAAAGAACAAGSPPVHMTGIVGSFLLFNASLSLYAVKETEADKPVTRALVHSQVLLYAATLFVQFYAPVSGTAKLSNRNVILNIVMLGLASGSAYALYQDSKAVKKH